MTEFTQEESDFLDERREVFTREIEPLIKQIESKAQELNINYVFFADIDTIKGKGGAQAVSAVIKSLSSSSPKLKAIATLVTTKESLSTTLKMLYSMFRLEDMLHSISTEEVDKQEAEPAKQEAATPKEETA